MSTDGFHEGQPVWVIQDDGSTQAGVYVGSGENATWFGGAPRAYVAFPGAGTSAGAEVPITRITPREADDPDA